VIGVRAILCRLMPVFRFHAFFPSFRTDRPPPPAVRTRSGRTAHASRGWLTTALISVSAIFASHATVYGQELPAAGGASGVPPRSTARVPASKPAWRDLSPAQQQALDPLTSAWDGLSESHKRKWLALSRNHAKLSPADQAVQHSRMKEWAALSQQQRAQARFNFAEVKQLPADERKAKWEAYQALSPEEKKKLAERAPSQPPGVAPTIRPVPARKLAPVSRRPVPKVDGGAALPPTGGAVVPAMPALPAESGRR
jgi:hypothetical protein